MEEVKLFNFYWQLEFFLKHLFEIIVEPFLDYLQWWETSPLMSSIVEQLYKKNHFLCWALSDLHFYLLIPITFSDATEKSV